MPPLVHFLQCFIFIFVRENRDSKIVCVVIVCAVGGVVVGVVLVKNVCRSKVTYPNYEDDCCFITLFALYITVKLTCISLVQLMQPYSFGVRNAPYYSI